MELSLLPGNYFDAVADELNYYLVGSSGVLVIEIATLEQKSYLEGTNFTCVWTNEVTPFIYLGTTNSGVLQLLKPVPEGDLAGKAYKVLSEPSLINNNVLALHGQDKDNYIVGTATGVSVCTPQTVASSSTLSPVLSVVLTERLDAYYSGQFGVYGKKGPVIASWGVADVVFDLGSTPALNAVPVTDLDVTYQEDDPVIAAATPSGVVIYRQRPVVKSSSTLYLTKVVI